MRISRLPDERAQPESGYEGTRARGRNEWTKTVHLGVFDTTAYAIIPWRNPATHQLPEQMVYFLKTRCSRGVPVEKKLAALGRATRRRTALYLAGRGKSAEPAMSGNPLQTGSPIPLGVINNPGSLGTGLLAHGYPQGQANILTWT